MIPLEGVHSEHCALIVDKGLSSLKDITQHKVELNNNRAVINTSNEDGYLQNVVNTIRNLGYNVSSIKKTFPVLNMSCASCASSSQTVLQHTEGVISATVNYANAMAQVEYIPTITNPEKLKASLQSAGYDLAIDESEKGKDDLQTSRAAQYQQLRKKTIAAVAFSIPLVIIGMFFMNMPYANIIMWALATPVVLWYGKDFFINGWKQLKHRSANMDTLVALSTGVAYIFSIFNTIFPAYWHSKGLHAHVYFEAAAVVIAFVLTGKLLEERAKGNTASALKKLIGLQPKTVTVVHEGGHMMEMPVADVMEGTLIQVKPGEKIAVDGSIVSGSSYVDESMISGEPVPVEKKISDTVFAGTINQKGSFQFKATKVGNETLLSQIIKMVQDAQGSKAPVQKLVDKIASVFVPVVIGIALATFIVWWAAGGDNGFTHGLMAMITVLVIACPCALGLATPTAIMVGVGKGASNGILIKDAESLETAKKINTVVLDKTGTITIGKPVVTNSFWLNEDDAKSDVIYSIEQQSEHPLADAITAYYKDQKPLPVDQFENITGQGVAATASGSRWFIGNQLLMQANNIELPQQMESLATEWKNQAKTVVYFSDDKSLLAIIAITDEIKSSSKDAIKNLQQAGIKVYMLTGDNEFTAAAVSKQVGIDHYKADMLPADKIDFIRKLQQEGKIVAMVGDGVNDSAALAQADVGIAMGSGSDIAMEVAKMTIISSDLNKIPQAIQLSKQTVTAIRQNLFWAFIYNIIGIPMAAGILYPVNGFLLDPMIAGAAMALSSVSVVGNSIRLKWKKL